MATIITVPNQASLHSLRSFLGANRFFPGNPDSFRIRFHPRFVYLQPFALAMLAAWAEYWNEHGIRIECENLNSSGVAYAWRMRLFDFVQVDYSPGRREHEEAGRFIPLRRITRAAELAAFLAEVAPLLHRPEHIRAVQYCLSETIRNVLEHAGGVPAYACAQYYRDAQRVSIGVADCGIGIFESLSKNYQLRSCDEAILESMRPGVSGAARGLYGSPDNAGAGLFFTKSIAKASHSYFALISGDAAYRLRRVFSRETFRLFLDPREDRHDLYDDLPPWTGTVVGIDIGIRRMRSFERAMSAIRLVYGASRPATGGRPRVHFT